MFPRLLTGTIRLYQRALSPLLPPACRFTPTCSEYAVQAIEAYGAGKGSWLAPSVWAICSMTWLRRCASRSAVR